VSATSAAPAGAALQPVLDLDALDALGDGAYWLATPSVRERVRARLRLPEAPSLDAVPADARTLVVVGGGTLLDAAKLWRRRERPGLRLVAVASLWGSGAEASPIAVANGPAGKEPALDPALRPDARVRWPELAEQVPDRVARDACGDTFAHALEAFLSPLATPALRGEAAALLNEAAALPPAYHPRWFELSACACELQAASSVGLVHGIAHQLEPRLGDRASAGHAALCATYALPVFDHNAAAGPKVARYAEEFGLDVPALRRALLAVHDAERYRRWLPALAEAWPAVVRDACSRTNAALVRPSGLAFFQRWTPDAAA
jgi:alcohol dehydrogenase class IV